VKRHHGVLTVTLIFVVILFGSVIYGRIESHKPFNSISVRLEYPDHTQEISLIKNEDNVFELYVPGNLELNNVKLVFDGFDELNIGGMKFLTDGSIESLEPGKSYEIKAKNSKGTIVVYHGSKVASVFLDSQLDIIAMLEKDKDYDVPFTASVYDENGAVDFNSSDKNDRVTSHGNTTALLKKLPFEMNFADSHPLLGMGEAQKWILLANAFDQTNLRNRIAFDVSERLGMEKTPESEYVDLYVHGEYQGLYLLSQKGEVDRTTNTLICANQVNRIRGKEDWFITKRGRCIEVLDFNYSDSYLKSAEEKVQKMEASLFSDDESYNGYIDTESWTKRLLIDEVLNNLDAEKSSSYYYWETADENSLIMAGPIWDYDLSLANINSKWTYGSDRPNQYFAYVQTWMPALMQKSSFKDYVVSYYVEQFRPIVTDYMTGDLINLKERIRLSSEMNYVRWQSRLFEKETLDEAINNMESFLCERMQFLLRLWTTDETYHQVKVGKDLAAKYIVFDGECFENVPSGEELGIDHFSFWVNSSTGKKFDPTEPVTEDITLIEKKQNVGLIEKLLSRKLIFQMMVAGVPFALLYLVLLGINLKRLWKERERGKRQLSA
jgi:hypothetical protein